MVATICGFNCSLDATGKSRLCPPVKFVLVRGFPLALPRDNSIPVVIIIDRSAPPADIFNMQQLMPGVPMFENSMETIHAHQWKEFSKQFPAQGPYLSGIPI
jgi:hypothetical protein